jgi:hypothetical protein
MEKTTMKKLLFLISILMFGTVTFGQQIPAGMMMGWQPPFQVPETMNPGIPYAGFTQIDAWGGPFIMYNPILLGRLPQPLWVFLRAHEYGHAAGARKEADADCWAAREISRQNPQLIEQIVWHLINTIGPTGGDAQHGNGYQMAAVVQQCRVR